MNVNNSILTSTNSADLLKSQEAQQTGSAGRAGIGFPSNTTSDDDVHLSELVRSLRALAAASPERQAKIENLARSYASGRYQVDSPATADSMIEDAITRH